MLGSVLMINMAALTDNFGGRCLGHISQCFCSDTDLKWLLFIHLNRFSLFCKAIYTIHFHLFLPGIASIMCVVAIYNTFFKQTTFEVNKSYLATARNSSPSKNSSEFYCKGFFSPITNSSCWTHLASWFKSMAKILILM